MGSDFTFQIIPCCKLTPERLEKAREIIANSADLELNPECETDGRWDEAMDVLDQYANGDYEKTREVSHLHLHGVVYYITGGVSWGDPPTEAYDDFSLIQECFAQFEQWSAEDANITHPAEPESDDALGSQEGVEAHFNKPTEEFDPRAGRTIWNSDGTDGPCLICAPPEGTP